MGFYFMYLNVLKNYAVFQGRARRLEYWVFVFFNFFVASSLAFSNLSGLTWLYLLAVLSPSLAVQVRRLHDTGRSGFWALLNLIPLLGQLVLVIFTFQKGQNKDNQYGPDPRKLTV